MEQRHFDIIMVTDLQLKQCKIAQISEIVKPYM